MLVQRCTLVHILYDNEYILTFFIESMEDTVKKQPLIQILIYCMLELLK